MRRKAYRLKQLDGIRVAPDRACELNVDTIGIIKLKGKEEFKCVSIIPLTM
jgi:hypothetical protein